MYIQPSPYEIREIRKQHKIEKEILGALEPVVEYRINNPELTTQREIVKGLKDKIIMFEAWKEYPKLRKNVCMFPAREGCEVKINHSFYHWLIYGNCCKTCSRAFNSIVTLTQEEEYYELPYKKYWDEFSTLDQKESDL